jgi:hypothetical protein
MRSASSVASSRSVAWRLTNLQGTRCRVRHRQPPSSRNHTPGKPSHLVRSPSTAPSLAGHTRYERGWHSLLAIAKAVVSAARSGTDARTPPGCHRPASNPRGKGLGEGSVTDVRPRSRLTAADDSSKACPTQKTDNHFVVDPTKFDFYAMDCYRILGQDRMAETLADEVIRAGTDFDGTERAPMRPAEARITLGVVATRQGDLEQAVSHGQRALTGQRKSLPSLVMVSRDLTKVLSDRYFTEPATQPYLDQLSSITPGPTDSERQRHS